MHNSRDQCPALSERETAMGLSRKTAAGQRSVTYRPRWPVVGRVLFRQGAVFQVLLLPPLAAAVLDGEAGLAAALAGPALLAGAVTLWQRRSVLPDDIRRIEAVLSVVLVFVLGALLATPAYTVLGLTPVDALFEATSALTTTGFSMIAAPEDLPAAAHVLRAWSQWCGGLVIAVAGLAFLMDPGPVSKALGFADFGEGRLETSTRSHAQALLLAYLAVTGIGVVGALLLVPGVFEGPLLALSAVSTGGMGPRGDSLASYPVAAQGFVVLMSVLGALSLAFPVLIHRRGLGDALRTSGVVSVLKLLLAALCASILFVLLSGEGSADRIWHGALTVLSLQSTAGFTIGPVPGPSPFFVLLIALMVIGGQTGSTAGGVKIDRARLLLGSVSLMFRRLLSPVKAVLYLRLDGEIIDPERVVFTVALVVAYAATAFGLLIAFTLHGLPPAGSLFDIVSALSTVGAGTGVIGPELPWDLKILTIFAMLLGRVEFFGFLVLAAPGTWIRRD